MIQNSGGILLKLYLNKCPECESHNMSYSTVDDEHCTQLCNPMAEVVLIATCDDCKHKCLIECLHTWIINGEY